MKSELEIRISEIQKEIRGLNKIIKNVQNKLDNFEILTNEDQQNYHNAKLNKLSLMNNLAYLKSFKLRIIPLENNLDNYSKDQSIDNINNLKDSLSKQYKNYSKSIKESLNIEYKGDIFDYEASLIAKINKLANDLVAVASDTDKRQPIIDDIDNTSKKLKTLKNILDDNYRKVFVALNNNDVETVNEAINNIINKQKEDLEFIIKPEKTKTIVKNDKNDGNKQLEVVAIEQPTLPLGYIAYDEPKEIENNIEAKKTGLKDKCKNKLQDIKDAKDDILNGLEDSNEEYKKEKKPKKGIKKFIKGALGALGIVAVIAASTQCMDKGNKKAPKEDKPKATVEQEYDQESLEYFTEERGIRKSDATELAQNSFIIDELLDKNGATDIKTGDIDELLADIYDGHNITSSAENYDSLDTFTSLENVTSNDIYNHLAGVPDYESIDVNKNSELLEYAEYLDINEGSKFDKYMTMLVEATQNYYLNLDSDEAAQNLIDTIYYINSVDGELNASEEGMITEYIMAVCGPLQINRNEQIVTGTKLNVDELFNIVRDIEVFEDDCTYTRTLN